jgi:hypothetical protein
MAFSRVKLKELGRNSSLINHVLFKILTASNAKSICHRGHTITRFLQMLTSTYYQHIDYFNWVWLLNIAKCY